MRTIELPDEVAEALEARASRLGLPLAETVRLLSTLETGEEGPIRSRPEVMGGDDCVRNTRIPVWLLVSMRQQGESDAGILESYPGLTTFDLSAAWEHFARHTERVEGQRSRHDADD